MNDEQFLQKMGERMDAEPPLSLHPPFVKGKLTGKQKQRRLGWQLKTALVAVPALLFAGFVALYGSSLFASPIRYVDSCSSYTQVLAALKQLSGSGQKTAQDGNFGLATDMAGRESSGDSYSKTNTQVAGVDEDDVAKTDGVFLYSISAAGRKVNIVRAGDAPVVTDTIQYDNMTPYSLYLSNSRLVVIYYENASATEPGIYSGRDTGKAEPAYDMMIYPYANKVTVKTFAVGADGKATETGSAGADGQYCASRMIGDNLYLITSHYVYTTESGDAADYIPAVYSKGEKSLIAASDITIPDYASSAAYTVVTAIDTASMNVTSSKALLGYVGTVYANTQHLYVAGFHYGDDGQQTQIIKYAFSNNAVVLRGQGIVNGIILNQFSMDEKDGYLRVATTVTPVYNDVVAYDENIQFTEKSAASSAVRDEVKPVAPDTAVSGAGTATQANPPDYDGKDTPAVSDSGNAGGNSGSYGNDTAVKPADGSASSGGSNSVNNIYVLNASLKVVGSVEGIAPGERIYSVRYMGSMVYVVTYRQVDPLFAISLENPTAPKVLGQLKIPGFSNYLHPWGDGLLMGLGRDATDEGSVKGLKFSMFNISDPVNPTEAATLYYGSNMTYSRAEYNHKAFLLDEVRGLVGVPYVDYTDQKGIAAFGYLLVTYQNGSFAVVGNLQIQSKNYDDDIRGITIGNTLYIVNSDSLTWAALSNPGTALGNLPL